MADQIPEGVIKGQEAWRYEFGAMPKNVAKKMWRCDVLTGELVRVELNMEKRWEMTAPDPKKPNQKMKKQIVNCYWIMTKSNYFYMHAKTVEEAKEKFEAEFAKAEQQIKDKSEKECLKKV